MYQQLSMERISRYARLALPLMSKHDIPLIPENYSVWFTYVSGVDKDLTNRIDMIIKNGAYFTHTTNEELYRQFFTEKNDHELERIHKDLHLALVTIIKHLMELSGQSQDYESFVSDSVSILSEKSSLEDIKKITREIIKKTKIMTTFSKTLKNELSHTMKTLDVLKKDFEQIKMEIIEDFLTGMANRKAFDETLAIKMEEAMVESTDLSLLLIDIDHFKKFNDKHGHLIGDEVLKFVAKKTREMVRGIDFVARFGGEEFAVLLPQTSLKGAVVVAENIRKFFAQVQLKASSTSKPLGSLTVSIGGTSYRPGEPPETFLDRCDQALYSAKKAGRNKVACA
ncbi:diguanylate cyclase [Syntrophus gentianae]|uniref:diguanylate cyclase n=1 Tax=Syntrophus gentianae TaxID=43775 RepID=A0A1H7Z3J6_9BACT|nr:GGDEF domain-containing protein [Syntrophus gentianae]SEM52793.1 diguanylate cyclase [Syntrophus gentianae]